MTEQRRVIARVLSEAEDHPDANAVYRRAARLDSRISMATVYRTIRLFEEANVLQKHDFGTATAAGSRKSRYEEVTDEHHDHLIDMKSGKVIEFQNVEIERLQREVAEKLGYRLVDHRLELYGIAHDAPDDDELEDDRPDGDGADNEG